MPVVLLTTLPSEPNPQRAPPVCPNHVVVCGACVSGALPRKHLPHIVCFDSTNATTDPLQESFLQLGLLDVASSGRPEQQESRQQEEETPPSLTPDWIWLGGLLHGQSHSTTTRPPQEMRDRLRNGCSPLREAEIRRPSQSE